MSHLFAHLCCEYFLILTRLYRYTKTYFSLVLPSVFLKQNLLCPLYTSIVELSFVIFKVPVQVLGIYIVFKIYFYFVSFWAHRCSTGNGQQREEDPLVLNWLIGGSSESCLNLVVFIAGAGKQILALCGPFFALFLIDWFLGFELYWLI